MNAAQSYRASLARFAELSARHRRAQNEAVIRCVVANVATGAEFCVTLSAVRRTETLTENGVAIVHQAQLRVLKACPWTPAERDEFTVVATGEVFRCTTATTAPTQPETVCTVIRISP